MRTNYSTYTDEVLLGLMVDDDRSAFEEIYQRYWFTLYSSAYSLIRDREQCKDIVQNVFIDLWVRKQQITIDNISGYLYKAVKFQVYKFCTRKSTAPRFYQVLEDIIESSVKTDSVILDKEVGKILQYWIDALPEKRRNIFMLHYFDKLSTAEIAEKLNISQKTVQNQLLTASTQIKARFAQYVIIAFLISCFLNRQ
ncbi:MAG TPA: sigma-70 family RNA polymerase sigma factor [Sphingobacteriaceae bacterium]